MNLDSVHRFIICYDVTSDARRERLANLLQTHGDRIQYSVFIVDTKPAKIVRLRAEMRQVIDTRVDSILLCALGPLSGSGEVRLEFMGRERPITDHGALIV